ncbi:unnamed protein product, partial [Polarella glacialis]
FTGRLACEYLASRSQAGLRWAMAGRSMERLEEFRKELPESAQAVELMLVDVRNEEQLRNMAKTAKVVANYAGTPFSDKALPVVAACVDAGCCYVDVTGEVPFMKTSILRYDAKAKETGALVVHACGFDSIPSDLGVMLAARAMRQRHGVGCERICTFALKSKGGVSGGTINSALDMLTRGSDLENADSMQLPYGLDPPDGRGGRDKGDFGKVNVLPAYDEDGEVWAIPFVMAPVNTRVVRRSNALAGYAYGESLSYGEVMVVPGPLAGFWAVTGMALGLAALVFPPSRWALCRWALPSPGEGPSRDMQNTGYFRNKTVAVGERKSDEPAPKVVVYVESGDGGDPGYKCTARMSIEAALCCALDRDRCHRPGGVVTPAFGLGHVLVDRLNAAGMKLYVEEP